MFKDRKAVITGLIVYGFCLYLVFFLYSPRLSVNAIKQAMQQQDVKMLDGYIDFNSLQQSVGDQLKTELIVAASLRNRHLGVTDALAMSNVSYAIKMVEDFIGLFVSRHGLTRLFSLQTNSPNDANSTEARKVLYNLKLDSFISKDDFQFRSFREIELKGYDENGQAHSLIFSFRYTRWVLTDIIFDLRNMDSGKIVKFIKKFQNV